METPLGSTKRNQRFSGLFHLMGSMQSFFWAQAAHFIPHADNDPVAELLADHSDNDLPPNSRSKILCDYLNKHPRVTRKKLLEAIEATNTQQQHRSDRLQYVFTKTLLDKFGYTTLTASQLNRLSIATCYNGLADSYIRSARRNSQSSSLRIK